MWKVEFRQMTTEERTELERVHETFLPSWREGPLSWVRGLFSRDPGPGPLLKEALQRDLSNGRVQVIHVTAGAALRLTHSNGRLAGFFIDIGSGLVLFVEPREWDAPEIGSEFEQLFPCTRFRLILAPHSGMDLDFHCDGPRFQPIRELEAPPQEVLDAILKDGEVLPARLNSLEEDLERLFTRSLLWSAPQAAG